MSNLAHTDRYHDCQRPTMLVSMKIPFINLIFSREWKVCFCKAVVLHCMLHCEYFMFPTPFRDKLNRFYCPLSAAYRVSDSKISVSNFNGSFTVKFMTDDFEQRSLGLTFALPD